MDTAPRTVVARYFDMWNTGDTSAVDEILHPDWTDHAHPDVSGPDDVRQAVRATRAARPDLRFHVDTILDDSDGLVAVVGGVGGVGGPQPTTSPLRLIWLVRVVEDRMVEMWTYQNQAPG